MIDDLYSAGLGEIPWDVPMHKLLALTQSRFVGLITLDLESNRPTPLAFAADNAGWLQAFIGGYQNDFHPYDPVVAVGRDWLEGRWLDEQRDISRAVREKGIYYQEFLLPNRVGATTGFIVSRDQATSTFLSFLSPPLQGCNPVDERRPELEALRPHIARAVRLQARLGLLQRQAALAESTLDTLVAPIFLLDESRALLLANAAAHRLMASEPSLRFIGNRFQPVDASGPVPWRKACEQGGIRLKGAQGQTLAFSLTPVPASAQLARHWQRPLVLMMGLGYSNPDRLLMLRSLYGLTRTEAELCAMLAIDGLTPQACADARQVAISTIRSQIKSIGAKLGTGRLEQIVQLTLRTCG